MFRGDIVEDVQNKSGDYKYKIDKVGVSDIIYPISIKNRKGEIISTVANIYMAVSLDRYLRGINMSRLPILLSELTENNWIINDIKSDFKIILENMQKTMGSDDAYIDMEFNFFNKKKAPISNFQAIMPYKCKIETKLIAKDNEYDCVLTVEVPITALCPCSKAISDFSAHNQRGYVVVSVRYDEEMYLEDIIEIVESVGSCELYPILKRMDEKYVTEKAYENPRFVEDIVRMVADKLYNDLRISWFKVTSKHQESIHPHDSIAVIEIKK